MTVCNFLIFDPGTHTQGVRDKFEGLFFVSFLFQSQEEYSDSVKCMRKHVSMCIIGELILEMVN